MKLAAETRFRGPEHSLAMSCFGIVILTDARKLRPRTSLGD